MSQKSHNKPAGRTPHPITGWHTRRARLHKTGRTALSAGQQPTLGILGRMLIAGLCVQLLLACSASQPAAGPAPSAQPTASTSSAPTTPAATTTTDSTAQTPQSSVPPTQAAPATPAPTGAAQAEIALLQADGWVVLVGEHDPVKITKLTVDAGPTDLIGLQNELVWSPDGYRLALPDGVWTLSDGTAPAPAHAPLSISRYRWSPDGQRLAWIADVDEHADALMIGGPDGDQARLIAGDHWGFTGPTIWSPDGGMVIAGQHLQDGATGAGLAALPAERGFNTTWSPDGKQLAWTSSDGDNMTLTTTVMLAAGAGLKQLATLPLTLSEPFGEARLYDQEPPVWLPDSSGLLIAAQTIEPRSRGTWLVGLDGAVTRLSPHTLCDLAPDGQRMLARTQDGMIVVVRLADGTIEATIGQGETATWRPARRGPAPSAPLAAKSPTLDSKTPPAQGEAVRELQQQLQTLGYDPGAIDGIYGPQTVAAVRRFQQENSLTADGVVGPQTWASLRAQLWRLWSTQQPPSS